MEVTLVELIEKYDLWVVLLAMLAIFVVGCIKVIFAKGFKKLGGNAKPIYETLSIIAAAGLAALWLVVKAPWFGMPVEAFTWALFIKEAGLVYTVVKVLYPLYENYKLRDLVRLIGRLIKAMFKKKKEEEQGIEQNTTIVI